MRRTLPLGWVGVVVVAAWAGWGAAPGRAGEAPDRKPDKPAPQIQTDDVTILQNPIRRQSGLVFSLAFSPDGKTLAVGDSGRSLRFYDPKTARELGPRWQPTGTIMSSLDGLAYSRDGSTLAVCDYDRVVLLDPANASPKSVLTLPAPDDGSRPDRLSASAAAFSPVGEALVIADSSGRVDLRESAAAGTTTRPVIATGLMPDPEKRRVGPPRRGSVFDLRFSPDGSRLAVVEGDGSVRIWDTQTWRPQVSIDGLSAPRSVAFSRDGSLVAVNSEPRQSGDRLRTTRNGIVLADSTTGKAVGRLEGHESSITGLDFLPDGKTLVSLSDDHTIRLWDVVGRREVALFRYHSSYHCPILAVSPDGRVIAAGGSCGPPGVGAIALVDVVGQTLSPRPLVPQAPPAATP